MPKELIAMIATYLAALVAPRLMDLGMPVEVAQEFSALAASAVFAVSAALYWLITKAPKISGPAMIAVTLIEESMKASPNDEKRTAAVAKLTEMIDAMDIGAIQKWFLKRAAPSAVEAIVKQAKVLLYKKPPVAAKA